ncbi:hypothetical protein GH714_029094 [Hevea brasiliensis]|uniref:Uncharacterized protein n=1 Tax=Hevea brasiliensis TaxID=3981 RepID=A0A6A6LL95_HEVBR|nr:hypothetical protein GH714_029094 [Hevea brasiliensis]
MSSILARTGRHRQRYENNVRLVSGCIPYRLRKDDDEESNDLENRIEVLMVSSPNRTDLVFPKGGWEDDETVYESSMSRSHRRSRSERNTQSRKYPLEFGTSKARVDKILAPWKEAAKESSKHKRCIEFCRYEWMREALEIFLGVIAEDKKPEMEEEIVELSSVPVPEVVADCAILSSNCCAKPVNGQHDGVISFPGNSQGACL